VRTLINEPSYKVNIEIESFCENRSRDDLLLMYFSGHGIKDADGRLYFATADTQLVQQNVRRATAVSANFVNEAMSRSRSRRQVLLLDCCYSGAFKHGMLAKGDPRVGAGEQLEGQGRIVLTASDALQYSFEGERVEGEGVRSIFTRTLVQGLERGEADLDCDGLFSLDEVYDYVYRRVLEEQPDQKPTLMGYVEGKIFIGTNPHPAASKLPKKLLETLESPLVWVRLAAVQQLETLYDGKAKGLALAAQAALESLARADDSIQVRAAAAKSLASRAAMPPLLEETSHIAELKTGPKAHTSELERPIEEKRAATGSLAEASPKMTVPRASSSAQQASVLDIGSGGKAQTRQRNRSVQSKKRSAEAEVQEKAREKRAPQTAPEVIQATRVASAGNKRQLLSLESHTDAVWSVAWSPDGKGLATASRDGTVKVWNAETGDELRTLRGHGGGVRTVDWTTDLDYTTPKNVLAAASTDGWFNIWDAVTGEEEGDDVVGGEGWLMAFRPQPQGEPKPESEAGWMSLLLGSKSSKGEVELMSLAHNVNAGEAWDDSPLGGVAIRKLATGEGLPILHHREVVRSIAWSPDGMRMATGTVGGAVRIWLVEKGKELLRLDAHHGPVTSLTWSPDGNRMASASEDGTAKIHGTRGGELLLSIIPAPLRELWCVAWNPHGDSLATGGEDQTARIWDAQTGKELLTLKAHSGAIRSVAWKPDGRQLATASDDKSARVWDATK
jgi:WD40 repeat protein